MNTQSKKSGVVLGGLLIIFGGMALLETVTDLGAWVWVAVLTIGGLLVYGAYATDRAEKWLLIISYTMLAVAGLVTLLTLGVLDDPFVPTYVLLAIALPFVVAFLLDRTKWGLLIPAYVLLVVGVMVPLTDLGVINDFLIVSLILFAIAIPFFVVYARNTKNWWALIPAGVLTIIGIAFLIAETAVQYIGPVVLVIIGLWIITRAFTRKEVVEPETPKAVPEVEEGSSE